MFTSKSRGRHRAFSYTPCPNTCIAFPVINIPHQNGTFFKIDELMLTNHSYPKSILYIITLWLTPGVIHSVGLDKCIMTCIIHCGIIQIIVTDLKSLCATYIHHLWEAISGLSNLFH